MTDDLVKLDEAYLSEMLRDARERHERGINFYMAVKADEAVALFEAALAHTEAATRLSPPAGDKVEAVARALYALDPFPQDDPDTYMRIGTLTWEQLCERLPHRAETIRASARAALAALPTPTAGEVMDGWKPIEPWWVKNYTGWTWRETTLAEAEIGLFMSSGGEELCVKTEYQGENGQIHAYIVSSGEHFWGGASTSPAQREVRVLSLTPPTEAPR